MQIALAILLLIIAACLAIGGVWLLILGGSGYYLGAGLALGATAFLVFRRHSGASWIYALFIAATLGWAVFEVGFDWWQLATRGGLLVLIGLWLLLLRPGGQGSWPTGRLALLAVLILPLGVAGYAMLQDEHAIQGRLKEDESISAARMGDVAPEDWPHYGRSLYGQRYSPLTQISRENVSELEVVWSYRTGDLRGPDDVQETTYQVTPIKVGDLLYLCTPHNHVIALDAASGREVWRFDPKVGLDPNRQHQTCRGVSFHADPERLSDTCGSRVFLPTADARLIALDARSGVICQDFGEGGTVDLWRNMPHQKSGFYYSTSPPVIAADLLVVGGAVNDNYAIEAPSGVIRAYDVNTGMLVWNWDSGNPDRTTPLGPGETYTANSPNSWSVASADEELGLIYIPLGNRTPDQLGMGRSAAVERFSSSIVALELATGKVRWVRQTVHHDLWDMDVPAQPVLLDLRRGESIIPALVGPTKQGDIYVLDRRNGEPIIPVREVPAPQGAISEDFTAPTQPVSSLTFMPEPLQERDMWGASLLDQLACRIMFRSLRYEGRYTPPSLQGTLVYPGNFGVFNWGSVAVDPTRQIMFGMPTYLAFTSTLVPAADIDDQEKANAGEAGLNLNEGGPYGVIMQPFLSPLGLPCQAPPWGYVAAADLGAGEIVWMHKNGTIRDAGPLPLPPIRLGVPGIGGPIITAGGVAFLGATIDDYLRAYDVTTGEQLWEQRLPAGGQSTPMTYAVGGRQLLVHVAGGHGSIGTSAGDFVIAYGLPEG